MPATGLGGEGVSSFSCSPSCLSGLNCAAIFCKTFTDLSSVCGTNSVNRLLTEKKILTENENKISRNLNNNDNNNNDDAYSEKKNDNKNKNGNGYEREHENEKLVKYGHNYYHDKNIKMQNIDIKSVSTQIKLNSNINYPYADQRSNECINNFLTPINKVLDFIIFDVALQVVGTTATVFQNDPQSILALRSAGVNSFTGVFLENIQLLSYNDQNVRRLDNTKNIKNNVNVDSDKNTNNFNKNSNNDKDKHYQINDNDNKNNKKQDNKVNNNNGLFNEKKETEVESYLRRNGGKTLIHFVLSHVVLYITFIFIRLFFINLILMPSHILFFIFQDPEG